MFSFRALFLVTSVLLLPACFSPEARNPVPVELTNEAGIPGVPGGRFWGDSWPTYNLERFEAMSREELEREFQDAFDQPHTYVAISGGGANGAYGAGLLKGWTETGTRPVFTMVTGISTGALTAPYAFLGSDYDAKLEEVYTTTSTHDLVEERGLFSLLSADSMTDTTGLRLFIERLFDQEVIDAIAAEHRKGRRLFVGTANLDAGRPVIWSIGEIASSDYEHRLSLIHDILQASAAIPVAFPPVMIEVEAGGQTYDEMHVDGGTASQVFVYPSSIDWSSITEALEVHGSPEVYVIRNAFLEPDSRGINRSMMPIAGRAIDSLIRTQGIGDLYQIHALCERDGNAFNLAWIPASFDEVAVEDFDPIYMRKLFDLGYDSAKDGYEWHTTPPGFGYDR